MRRLAWLELTSTHLGGGDGGKRGDIAAIDLLPERGVGNVKHLVRVQRDGDVVNLAALRAQPCGQTLHVGMCSGHGQAGAQLGGAGTGRQIAEIVLRVDQQQLAKKAHGASNGTKQ